MHVRRVRLTFQPHSTVLTNKHLLNDQTPPIRQREVCARALTPRTNAPSHMIRLLLGRLTSLSSVNRVFLRTGRPKEGMHTGVLIFDVSHTPSRIGRCVPIEGRVREGCCLPTAEHVEARGGQRCSWGELAVAHETSSAAAGAYSCSRCDTTSMARASAIPSPAAPNADSYPCTCRNVPHTCAGAGGRG